MPLALTNTLTTIGPNQMRWSLAIGWWCPECSGHLIGKGGDKAAHPLQPGGSAQRAPVGHIQMCDGHIFIWRWWADVAVVGRCTKSLNRCNGLNFVQA